MKKLSSMLLLSFVLVLTACSGNDAPKETPKEEKLNKDEQSKEETKQGDSIVEEESEIEAEEPTIELEEEPVVEEPALREETEEDTQVESRTYITVEEVKEIIEYSGMSEDDTLIDASVEGDEIKVVIDLVLHELLPENNIATSSYSQASDALLERDDWQVLTIEYVGIGKISMNRFEKESNEFGDYFPTTKIEAKLK